MEDQKFQCKLCGVVLKGEHARRDHCQNHHPSTPFKRLDVYFPIEYKKLTDDKPINTMERKIAISSSKTDKHGNVTYTTHYKAKLESSFDCSRAIPINVPLRPQSTSDEDLFEFAVKRVAHFHNGKPSLLDANTITQWPNICFGYSGLKTHERQNYMSRVKDAYAPYFKRSGFKYSFDFEQIIRDYPHFFKGGDKLAPTSKVNLPALIDAVETEIKLSQKPGNRLKYKVKKIEKIGSSKILYQLYLDLNDDDMPSFYEGISIKLKVGETFYDCDGIDYDQREEILTVRTNRTIFGGYGIIYLDTTFILKAIVDKLQTIRNGGLITTSPIKKFIPENTRSITKIANVPTIFLPIVNNMDNFQKKAHEAAVNNDICFIWGPPGTGKSFTLAGLINTFFRNNSSTLVCCISNVALDQLLNKVIDVVDSLELHPYPGQILRSGHTIDNRLMEKDYLFPSDSETKRIREHITELTFYISSPSCTIQQKALFKENRITLRERLKKRTEALIAGSKIVFSTIANYVLSSHLAEKIFDNLIVDEASMLSLPYLMAIGGKIAKRVILVGDPNQLGPISINPNKLLTNSIFDYCKVFSTHDSHPALHQLLTQRRSHSYIVNLFNDTFYGGRLVSIINNSPKWVSDGPLSQKVICVINEDCKNNQTQMIGTSRRNFGTCQQVMQLLNQYFHYWTKTMVNITIGIITPYRAQVRMYYAKIKDEYGQSEFYKNIKIGTIHTFQGSECDLVFLDLVEKAPTPVSKLLNQKDGERLINVALSRARHKIIIVGDTKRFEYGTGISLVSNKVCRVLTNLRNR